PWRLAPDKNGRLSIMLLEKDRWGKTRKYAVRPFGRYENLVLAVTSHVEAERAKRGEKQTRTSLARPSFIESLKPNEIKDHAAVAGAPRRFLADAVVEGTEPLAAPVILATRRNDKRVAGLPRPGDTIQIVVSRHPEEVLADANTQVDAGLAMRHVAVGFWREFAAPRWAKKVGELAGLEATVDLLAEFGPFRSGGHDYKRLPAPKGLSIIKKPEEGKGPIDDIEIGLIRELYERHPDLWRGAYALNLAAMPYG